MKGERFQPLLQATEAVQTAQPLERPPFTRLKPDGNERKLSSHGLTFLVCVGPAGCGARVFSPCGICPSFIYNSRHRPQSAGHCGETTIPQAGQLGAERQTHGRQVPESKPKEVLAENQPGQQRRPEEAAGRGRQAGEHQEKVTCRSRCLPRFKNLGRQFSAQNEEEGRALPER